MTSSVLGKCHCGATTWEADLPHTVALNCHCNMCRSLSGADYSSWLVIPSGQFRILSGQDNTSMYKASGHFSKTFCSNCGSTISSVNSGKFPGHIYIAKGNITSEYSLGPEIQVYTVDKADWVAIDASIPVVNP